MIEAGIFDMDGLLVDSEPLWQEAEIEVFGEVGLRLTRAQCMETKGRRVDETIAYWHERCPWTGASLAEIERRLVRRVEEIIRARGEAKPGVDHALQFFRGKGAKLALASSSSLPLIHAVLDRLKLEDAFEVVHTATEESAGKPDPAVYLTTARRLGIEPRRCVALEDSIHGVLAAKAAGMTCIAVPDDSSGDPEQDRAMNEKLSVADVVLGSLADLDEETWRRIG